MAMQRQLLLAWNWLIASLRNVVNSINATFTSNESSIETLRTQIVCADDYYNPHDILGENNKVKWPEWQMKIDENDKVMAIVESFHDGFKKMTVSTSIVGRIRIIQETLLKFIDENNQDWQPIKDSFKIALETDDPLLIIKAYTFQKAFSRCLNQHSAANTYHLLKLYCTLLNCPVLARTQEYTEAFTEILFHPKLNEYLVQNKKVYRGIVIKDRKFIENCNVGAIIITTTFLSTSLDLEVAAIFATPNPKDEDGLSLLCEYNIRGVSRRVALDIQLLSKFPDEQEVLLLRFIPFKITTFEQSDDGRKIKICFDEFIDN